MHRVTGELAALIPVPEKRPADPVLKIVTKEDGQTTE